MQQQTPSLLHRGEDQEGRSHFVPNSCSCILPRTPHCRQEMTQIAGLQHGQAAAATGWRSRLGPASGWDPGHLVLIQIATQLHQNISLGHAGTLLERRYWSSQAQLLSCFAISSTESTGWDWNVQEWYEISPAKWNHREQRFVQKWNITCNNSTCARKLPAVVKSNYN